MTKFTTKVAVKYSNLFTKLDGYLYPNSIVVWNKERAPCPLSIVNADSVKGVQRLLLLLSYPQLKRDSYKDLSITDMIVYMDLDKLIKTVLHSTKIFEEIGINPKGKGFKRLISSAIKTLLDLNKNLCIQHLKNKEAIYIATKI